jgi:release factor glutamine methyltransferase
MGGPGDSPRDAADASGRSDGAARMETRGRTAGEVLADVASRLERAGVPTPRVDAELLVAHATGWSRAGLRTATDEQLPDQDVLEPLVVRRARREPLQLIVGTVGFRYLELEVRPGVFIPRPETETLAGEAVARTPADGLVVEPCTGTGAVACAVATEARARVVATDRAPAAVALARANVQRTGAQVEVLQGDLLGPVDVRLRGRVDVVVSNPPYVADDETAGLEPEVVAWDPRDALVSGPTGHEVSDRLIDEARGWLASGGWLLMEVDAARAAEAARRCSAAGYAGAAVMRDLADRDRVVVARWP